MIIRLVTGFQILQILVELYLTKYLIQAFRLNHYFQFCFLYTSGLIMNALYLQTLRYTCCSHCSEAMTLSWYTRYMKKYSQGDFQLYNHFRVQLQRYTAVQTTCLIKQAGSLALSLIALALSLITPPEYSVPLFCSCIQGAEGSRYSP